MEDLKFSSPPLLKILSEENEFVLGGVKNSLVSFQIKNFVKQQLFCPNINEIKKLERWDI